MAHEAHAQNAVVYQRLLSYMQCNKITKALQTQELEIMATKTFAPVLPHSHPATDSVGAFFAKIGRFFVVGFDVFNEAQAMARKAHAKYPFAE